MAEIRSDHGEINARIVYWGIPGAGISANLAMLHGKLKENNRGDLRRIPTRIDPTVEYEMLPIELGHVGGVRTRLHIIGVPGAREQAPTRKQLLDRIDGAVFVADSRPECIDANIASLNELLEFLADYGNTPDDLPFVIQYNKCDLVDPFVIERLHREIQIRGAAVYEASALTGTGILKTLTTISKQVIRHLGRRDAAPPTLPPTPQVPPAEPSMATAEREIVVPISSGSVLSVIESAILAEAADDVEAAAAATVTSNAQAMLDQPWDAVSHTIKPEAGARIGADLRIVSIGEASRVGNRGVSIPLVLGNAEGETVTLALSIQLDPLLDGDT